MSARRDSLSEIEEANLASLDGIHIDYMPWVSKYNAATRGSLTEQAARSLAFAGVLAPIGRCLEIKGGWIASDGTEWRDPTKAHRSREIRDYGFT